MSGYDYWCTRCKKYPKNGSGYDGLCARCWLKRANRLPTPDEFRMYDAETQRLKDAGVGNPNVA